MSGRMLNDGLIDAASKILRKQFPDVRGLQSPVIGESLSFRVTEPPFELTITATLLAVCYKLLTWHYCMAHVVLLLIAQSRAVCILVVTPLILWLHLALCMQY